MLKDAGYSHYSLLFLSFSYLQLLWRPDSTCSFSHMMNNKYRRTFALFILLCFCVAIKTTFVLLSYDDALSLPMDATSIKKVPYSSGDETSRTTSNEVDMDGGYTIASEQEQRKQNDLDKVKTESSKVVVGNHSQQVLVLEHERIDRYAVKGDEEGKKIGAPLSNKTEIIQIENNNWVQASSTEKSFSHFFVHIPKAGGGTTFSMTTQLVGGGVFKDIKPWAYRPCNEGTNGSFLQFRKEDSNGTPCNFWITEQPYGHFKMKQRHTYTIVRSPMEHVVSQYFHCKESKDHEKYAYKMPASLDDWLDHHVQRMDEQNITRAQSRAGGKFRCYDAINLQSMMTGFDETMSESQLRNRFDVIGVMDQLAKSACAINIRYTGAIHPSCDCTDVTKSRRRNLRDGDHGVKHHGATFNLTDSQASKIQKLTQLDSLLYDRAKVAFANQVKEIEEELDIVLCQNPDLK